MRQRNRFILAVSSVIILIVALLAVLNLFYFKNTSTNEEEPQQVYWYLDQEGHLEIYGNGPMTETPWLAHHALSIRSVSIGEKVTSVASDAFRGCAQLQDVVIGSGVTSVGAHAFAGCEALTNLSFPAAVTAVGEGAFAGCVSLKSIHLFEGVTHFGASVFTDCSALTDVYYEGTEAQWKTLTEAYAEDAVLSGVTVHYEYSVQRLEYVSNGDGTCTVSGVEGGQYKTLLIPALSPDGEPVTAIGEGAFADCTTLTAVVVPGSVTSVGPRAFADCTNLTSVELPGGLAVLGERAFYGCGRLKEVQLPFGITELGAYTFAGCESLITVTVPKDSHLSELGEYVFYGCSALTALEIPGGVTVLPRGLFEGCVGLTEVILPLALTEIKDLAFYRCESLADVRYEGTEREFAALTVGSSNDALTSAVLHPHHGQPISTIASAGMSLGSDIAVNYYVNLQPHHEGAQMRFSLNDLQATVDGVAMENGRYMYVFKGVTPQCMGDAITAELVWNGRVLDVIEGYSVLTYCESMMRKTAQDLGLSSQKYAALQILLADTLAYGAQAQIYCDYKTDALVTDLLSTEGVELRPSDARPTEEDNVITLPPNAVDGIRFASANVLFDYDNKLYITFYATEYALLVVKEGTDEIATITYKGLEDLRGYATEGVFAVDFNTVYTFELYALRGEERVLSQTLTYSINTYAYRTVDKTDDNGEPTAMARLALALYRYGVSSENYITADRPLEEVPSDGV